MTCRDVEEHEIAEAYLLGRLDPAERDAFEEHYFECAQCYSRLQVLRSVREALASVRVPAPHGRRVPWPWLAAAATIIVAVAAGLLWTLQTATRHSPVPAETSRRSPDGAADTQEVRLLAEVSAPPYEPRQFRSAGGREAFTTGMRQYTRRDYAGAIPWLERALKEEPDADDVRFYLGATLILQDRSADGASVLRPLAMKAESPYAEEAQFLIAKAHLRGGDLEQAASALDATVKMHGDREAEASRLRRRVAELQAGRPK
jgi:tetratricopeptide (TPR) repeat protein